MWTLGRHIPVEDEQLGTKQVPRYAGGEVDRAAAEEFLELFYSEIPEAGPMAPRVAAVRRDLDQTGTYWHTTEELAFGARLAWRNNARCVGRLYWRSLQVRDLRTVSDSAGVARQCFKHLREAHNGGRIRPLISVFPPDTPRLGPPPGSGTSNSSGTPATSSRADPSSVTPAIESSRPR